MVAVKKLSCSASEEVMHQIRKESAILQKVANHPNIVQFFGTCASNPPLLCIEYMEVRELS